MFHFFAFHVSVRLLSTSFLDRWWPFLARHGWFDNYLGFIITRICGLTFPNFLSYCKKKKRSNNGDGHANVKREIGLDWQNNNFARASRFLVQYDVKVPNFTKNSTPEEFAYTWQSKLVGIIAMKFEKPRIHHFHIDHNAPCLLPKILHIHCFQFLLGNTVVPREIQDDDYAKLWGVNKMHYGLCAGEYSLLRDVSPTSLSSENC